MVKEVFIVQKIAYLKPEMANIELSQKPYKGWLPLMVAFVVFYG